MSISGMSDACTCISTIYIHYDGPSQQVYTSDLIIWDTHVARKRFTYTFALINLWSNGGFFCGIQFAYKPLTEIARFLLLSRAHRVHTLSWTMKAWNWCPEIWKNEWKSLNLKNSRYKPQKNLPMSIDLAVGINISTINGNIISWHPHFMLRE